MNYRIMNYPLVLMMTLLFGAGIFADSHAQKKDNLGKEFYVAFGPNEGSGAESENLFALYITSPVTATGYVEVPALSFRQNFVTSPGQITTITLPNGGNFGDPTVEITDPEIVIKGMSVHIVADTEVAVYGMSHKQYSSDAFMALPIDVLGTEYRTMNYQTSIASNAAMPGEFWVVAIIDSTNITITPNATTSFGKPANSPINVLLNRGDTYLVLGDPNTKGNDLTGSLIESDLPIAVFTGHMRAGIPEGFNNVGTNPPRPSRDHLIEQVPPVSAWGDSALVIPYSTSDYPDVVRIVSAEDNNTITVNGANVATLNAGQFYEIASLSTPTSITATNPILVGQYMHTSKYGLAQFGDPDPYGDPALALVYPVEQFTTGYTFISIVDASAFSGNFFNVVVEQSGVTGLLLDGTQIPASNFSSIPGSSFVYAQIRVQQGTHNISGPKPFGITVYALGNVDSYAYTGGTLLKTITPFKTDDIVIDFGDRLLRQRDWYGQWDSLVSLHNISSDSLTIFYFQRRTGDTANFTVAKPDVLPHGVPAFAKDNMTLRFNPLGVPNVRMRTTINAKTEHLRAYVVDVYGRGVVGLPMSFVDSNVTKRIDTIYFGIHGQSSPPVDRLFYLGNTGTAPLNVHEMKISGPDANDFSVLGSEDLNTNPLNVPYTVGLSPEKPVRVNVRFTPGNPRAPRLAYLDINDSDKVDRRVVLIAIVDTVTVASVTPVTFDSLYICDVEDKIITVTNNNSFSVTLQNIVITGAPEFIILDGLPIVISPNSSRNVRIRFAPNSPGIFAASLTAYFDLPTNSTQTLSLTAVAKEPIPFFWSPRNIHILAEEEVLYPIYAKIDLARMVSSTYTIDINYDPRHLSDVDIVQDNTLSLFGYFTINGFEAGERTFIYQTADGSIIQGGGEEETRPLVFIKFRSHLGEEDRLTIADAVDINYTVTFAGSPLPVHCQAQSALPGRITIDSSCADVHIVKRLPDPFATYIHQPTPNPATSGYIDAKFDVPSETSVKMVLVDALGQIAGEVVNEVRQQGRYTAHISTAGLANGVYTLRLEAAGVVKFRKIIVSK